MSSTLEVAGAVEFTETMRGFFSTQETEDFGKGFERGQREDSKLEFTLTVRCDDVGAMIRDPKHESRMWGSVVAPAISANPLVVEHGRFGLFVRDAAQVGARRMVYRVPMKADDGTAYHLEGYKLIHDDPGADLWSDTTTLYVTVRRGSDGNVDDPIVGKGIVKIHPGDFVQQLRTMRAVDAPSPAEGLRAVAAFGQFFAGILAEVYGGPIAPADAVASATGRRRRFLKLGPPEVHTFDAADGVTLRLTRYCGGTKGPVILSPGFGTSSLAFTIDTVDTNFPEYLYARGYDVWVFDYRASPALPSAGTSFTLDDVATKDYPAAVDKVREVTAADSVQVVGHCVGSLTFLMGMAAGLQGVRSAVCSQLTLHPVAPPLNMIKANLRLARLFDDVGVDTLTTDFEATSGLDKLFDGAMRFWPTRETCNSPTCRRILFMYGEVYSHGQLNPATHDAMHEMFGVANTRAFAHVSKMISTGHAVAADGGEAYLPNVGRLKIPITFIHGEQNRLFLPEGSLKTFDYLSATNGPSYYARHVIPGYAHMDCFIGKDAARDVYPLVLAELEKYNDPASIAPAAGNGNGNGHAAPAPAAAAGTNAAAAPRSGFHQGSASPGLKSLFGYPFMSALVERRTRRVARGTSINAGELSHQSANAPAPLGKLEEAILIVCTTGITGVVTHDGPLVKPDGGEELGTPFMNIAAKAASSADNCQATHFFMINDDGMFLLRTPKGRAAMAALADLPPRWADWSEADWISAAELAKVRVSDRRMEFPRAFPYYVGWNKQTSNVPGTTIFLPVVDLTRQYINALLILLAEPDGQRPLIIDDWRQFHPRGVVERLAKLGGALGLSEEIPYHPVGGLKWARNGFVDKKNLAPLGLAGALRTDYESFFYLQNLMLLGQAMGVGSWVHGSVFAPYVWQRDAAKGWHGLGFRMEPPRTKLRPMPPVVASQPHPVGIDGVLEGLCPPYVKNMDDAVNQVLDEKYGPEGAYGDVDSFARPYRDRRSAEAYLRRGRRYSDRSIAYTREVCHYVNDTYGRFPAHCDAFYTPAIWIQFAHLELEYYDKFFDPGQYAHQAAHDAIWHPGAKPVPAP